MGRLRWHKATTVPATAAMQSQGDAQLLADVLKALDNKRFANVKVHVENGLVTLTGTVEIYSAKEDAGNKVHHRKNVKGVEI